MKKILTKLFAFVAPMALTLGVISANSPSYMFFCQPEVPAELLAKKANATSLTFLNLIDSYKEQSEFVKYLESEYQNLGIHTDQMTSDYKNK